MSVVTVVSPTSDTADQKMLFYFTQSGIVFEQDDSVSPSPSANPVIPPSLTSRQHTRISATVSEGWGMGVGDRPTLIRRMMNERNLVPPTIN